MKLAETEMEFKVEMFNKYATAATTFCLALWFVSMSAARSAGAPPSRMYLPCWHVQGLILMSSAVQDGVHLL